MSAVAIALAVAQAASAAQGAQPSGQLPCFEDRGATLCVRSIVVSGSKKDMDAARPKLTSEGWSNSYRADRSGKTVLNIETKNRSLDDAWALTNRFSSKEFGPLQADFDSFHAAPGAK